MTLPTKEDIERLIFILGAVGPMSADPQAAELASKLTGLLSLYEKRGLPIEEVDVYLLGEVLGRVQRTQIHTFAVGDKYKLLPEDEDPEVPADGWDIQDIRAHVKEDVSVDNGPEAAEEAE